FEAGQSAYIRIVRTAFAAGPDLLVRVAARHEQDLARLFGREQQDGAGFHPAGEIVKIRLLEETGAEVARVARGAAEQHSDAVLERFAQFLATMLIIGGHRAQRSLRGQKRRYKPK